MIETSWIYDPLIIELLIVTEKTFVVSEFFSTIVVSIELKDFPFYLLVCYGKFFTWCISLLQLKHLLFLLNFDLNLDKYFLLFFFFLNLPLAIKVAHELSSLLPNTLFFNSFAFRIALASSMKYISTIHHGIHIKIIRIQ